MSWLAQCTVITTVSGSWAWLRLCSMAARLLCSTFQVMATFCSCVWPYLLQWKTWSGKGLLSSRNKVAFEWLVILCRSTLGLSRFSCLCSGCWQPTAYMLSWWMCLATLRCWFQCWPRSSKSSARASNAQVNMQLVHELLHAFTQPLQLDHQNRSVLHGLVQSLFSMWSSAELL